MEQLGKSNEMELATLCDGAVANQFRAGVEAICRNIMDANTDATVKRVITIKVEFMPDKNRKAIDIGATVKVAVPGHSEVHTLGYVQTRAGGKIGMLEHTPPEQQALNIVEQLKPAVVGGKDTKDK